MKKIHIFLIIAIIIFLFFFIAGTILRQNCSEIDGCSACWQTVPITVTSDLCPNPEEPCIAEPYMQQYNAIVDVLLCACERAKANNYGNADLNSKIEELIELSMDYTITADTLCEEPGIVLTKMNYG